MSYDEGSVPVDSLRSYWPCCSPSGFTVGSTIAGSIVAVGSTVGCAVPAGASADGAGAVTAASHFFSWLLRLSR